MDIDNSESDNNTALSTSKLSGNRTKGKKSSGNSSSDSFLTKCKTCSWGKRHNSRESEGHTWYECFRLQALNKDKKAKEKEKDQEANITTEAKVRNKSFYFDTACTSQITPYTGYHLNYTKSSGFVQYSS